MRYKTAAIACFALIVGMFAFPAVIEAIFLPSLRRGVPNPIPLYERALLETAVFCERWKFLFLLPLVGLGVFFTALQTTVSRPRG